MTGTTSTQDGLLRARRHRGARRHSMLVRALRRAIPLAAAAGCLGVVGSALHPWWVSRQVVAVDMTSIESGRIVMAAPRLFGTRQGELPFEVKAARGLQEMGDTAKVELQEIDGEFGIDARGGTARIRAPGGLLDTKTETLELNGDIGLTSSYGDSASLASATVDLKRNVVRSTDPVTVVARGMRITSDGIEVHGSTLVSFIGRVHTVIAGGSTEVASADAPP